MSDRGGAAWPHASAVMRRDPASWRAWRSVVGVLMLATSAACAAPSVRDRTACTAPWERDVTERGPRAFVVHGAEAARRASIALKHWVEAVGGSELRSLGDATTECDVPEWNEPTGYVIRWRRREDALEVEVVGHEYDANTRAASRARHLAELLSYAGVETSEGRPASADVRIRANSGDLVMTAGAAFARLGYPRSEFEGLQDGYAVRYGRATTAGDAAAGPYEWLVCVNIWSERSSSVAVRKLQSTFAADEEWAVLRDIVHGVPVGREAERSR